MRWRRGPTGISPRLMRDIHVIHRPAPLNFAFATRRTESWSRGDRGGRPSLQKRETLSGENRRGGRDRRTDLRRPAMSTIFGWSSGPAGKRRRKRYLSLARCGTKAFLGMRRAKQDAMSGCPKQGRRRRQRTVFGLARGLKKRTPELVRQDRGAVGPSGRTS